MDHYVYFATNWNSSAIKVGHASNLERRKEKLMTDGWFIYAAISMSKEKARRFERNTIKNWRRLGIPFGAPISTPGYTESRLKDWKKTSNIVTSKLTPNPWKIHAH